MKLTLPAGVTPESMLNAVDKALCEQSLVHFIKQAWHVIEPGNPYVHNWHVDFISAHLEAITNEEEVDGDVYNRLLINVPPGASKSTILNIMWPAWEWGPKNMPWHRYICAAHQQNLAIRDGLKMRRLVMSDWYQERWGDRVKLVGDQNSKIKFENSATGFRESIAAGSITGSRGTRVLVDDPLSVEGANSDAIRQSTIEWFREAVPTRLNDPKTSAIVVIMQRLHEEDVSGLILEDPGFRGVYDHICIPMHYDPARSMPTKLGLEDPRVEEGQLFFPERFPEEIVQRDSRAMGEYATAGQFEQAPVPRGGGIIKPDWWQPWEDAEYPAMEYIVASLDTAYTLKQENDYSALTIMGVFAGSSEVIANRFVDQEGVEIRGNLSPDGIGGQPSVMLMYAWQKKLPIHELVNEVAKTCSRWGVDTLLIENKAAGYPVAQELRRMWGHEKFGVRMFDPGIMDKDARLHAIATMFADGQVYAPDKAWADEVIRQCSSGSRGKHDDLADCVSMSIKHLRDIGALQRAPERLADLADSIRHKGGPIKPLYGV